MKRWMTAIFICLLWLVATGILSAQNMDSVEGDFIALQALYNSTQGDGVEALSSVTELPSPEGATYPYMYIIDGEIYALSKERLRSIGSWINHGSIWKDKSGWESMTPETMGDAVGVDVNSDGRVIKLDMQKVTTKLYNRGSLTTGNGLIGNLPSEIGNLKKMKWLNLKQNFFIGEIPDVFNEWNELERISFGGQTWEIDVDDRGGWHESDHRRVNHDSNPFTISVDGKKILSTNNFKTELPKSLGSLPKLDLIEIAHQYIYGSLPIEWGNLPAIRGIYMPDIRGDENVKLGEIPESWGNLNTMWLFNLSGYHTYPRFSGQLPDGMKNWTELYNVVIPGMSGVLPDFVGFTDMYYFAISGDFEGEFPWDAIFNGNNSRLNNFSIANSNYTGELPKTIPPAKYPIERPDGKYRLARLNLHGNNFTGEFPKWAAELSGLQILNIYGNNFTGEFPWAELAAQSNLKTVRIQDNNFSGVLPSVEWITNRISWFYIGGNNFEGEIPDSWQTLFQHTDGSWNLDRTFERYSFDHNNFSGRLPDWAINVNWGSQKAYSFHNNRYTFKDIGYAYDELKEVFGDNLLIEDQKPFGESQNRTMPVGDQLIIDMGEYHYEGNEYRWLKNGTPIAGENSPVLTISNLNSEDEGTYELEVVNNTMPELGTQISMPIFFEIGENDGLNGSGESDKSDGSKTGGTFPSAPSLYGPDHLAGNTGLLPQFSWSNIDADYYILHVSRSNPTGMYVDVMVKDTSYTPDEIFDDGTVHDWRVRGVKNGELGEWSDIRRFTTGDAGLPEVAELVSPGHFAQEVDPALELVWEDVAADSYEIRLWNKQTNDILFNDVSTTASYTPLNVLPDTTEFIWQVKSISSGIHGAWGPRWEFSTGIYSYSVEAPSLVAPDPGSEYNNLTPVFVWSEVDADHYVIEVTLDVPSNAKSMSGIQTEATVILDETTETQYMPQNSLNPETHYYWRVRSVKGGEESGWSEVWEFTTPESQQSVSNETGEQPFQTFLAQNYPNPFNPSTQIEFTLSMAQNVSLRVYDMAGRQVATLVDGLKQAGRHSATFSADQLASGIYLYRFVSETHQFTRKMTLVK